MDGVLYTNKKEIGCLRSIFADIDALGLKVLYGTNNATKTPEEYCQKMAGFGVEAKPEQFFSSSIATVYQLKKDFPNGARIYVIGTESLKRMVRDAGFEIAEENVDLVLTSADFNVTYAEISLGMRNAMKCGRHYATNGDMTFPTEIGWQPGAGMIVNAVEVCSGVKANIIGKPNPAMLLMACEANGLKPEEVLAVGDRHGTDILSGHNAGAHTALVMTGYETEETLPTLDPQPELVCKDLTELIGMFK